MAIYLSDKKIEEIKQNPLSYSYKTAFGNCYHYNDKIIKIFKHTIDNRTKQTIERNLKLESKIVLYPVELVKKYNNRLIGYTMDKAEGIDLLELATLIMKNEKDLSFDELLRLYYDKFYPELVKEQSIVYDAKMEHTFISKDNISLIDTDYYEEFTNNTYFDKSINISLINFVITNFIHELIGFKYSVSNYNRSDSSYLMWLLRDIPKYTDSQVNSFRKLYEFYNTK